MSALVKLRPGDKPNREGDYVTHLGQTRRISFVRRLQVVGSDRTYEELEFDAAQEAS